MTMNCRLPTRYVIGAPPAFAGSSISDQASCGLVEGPESRFASLSRELESGAALGEAHRHARLLHREQEGLRGDDETTRVPAEGRELQSFECWMIAGPGSVRNHPSVLACVQVDRCDPAIGSLHEGKTSRPFGLRSPRPCHVAHVGSGVLGRG